MLHRARIAHLARTAARFHVRTGEPSVDLAGIVDEKNDLVAKHRREALRRARAAPNLTLVEGAVRFVSEREVRVANRTLRADRIFVATGMRPLIPPIDGLERVPVLTNESLMELTEPPEHLVVVGGGYVACELGQAFRRYGSRVTLVHSRDHLVPLEEPDVSTLLERAFLAEGIALVLGHRVARAEPTATGVRVVARPANGDERAIEGTHLLVAAGRRPNTDALDLAAAGVRVDDRGFAAVDDYLETSAPGVWAIGDVNGQQPYTRVCQEEGKVAYANAFEGRRLRMERRFLGHAVFTDPEIGSVGLTEAEARQRGFDVAAGLVTLDRVEKAELIGETTGLIKYVAERATHRLLGCHVIGPQAAELVYDAVIVMRHGGTLDELGKAVGIFPTLQEGMEGTARGLLRRIAPADVQGPLVTAPIDCPPERDAAGEPEGRSAPLRLGQANGSEEVTDMAQTPRFRCPACGAEFETRAQLEEHGRQHHGAQAGQSAGGGFRCPACGAEFPTQESLEEHARREHARVTS
jgi:pyruvate/2-oxoglutarate dehydrogenase complex dihydrolipoamide dehydrogenase (E3) component/uncharacterized C2H2 Zn-finger protein